MKTSVTETKSKVFKFKAKVWLWPGVGGWHFVNVDKKVSEQVKKIGKPYGAGFIKIKAKVGKTYWQTALFPHTESKSYLLSIKARVRKKEDIFEGDLITINFELI